MIMGQIKSITPLTFRVNRLKNFSRHVTNLKVNDIFLKVAPKGATELHTIATTSYSYSSFESSAASAAAASPASKCHNIRI